MNYAYSKVASRAATCALLATVVTLGSAIPASASQSTSEGAAAAPYSLQSMLTVASGPVHPLLDLLLQLI